MTHKVHSGSALSCTTVCESKERQLCVEIAGSADDNVSTNDLSDNAVTSPSMYRMQQTIYSSLSYGGIRDSRCITIGIMW
ncbi:hypothetical protein DPMN_139296 [Dreissena polymorpha]|uniref:Uncharacterized protein n=1 Tax=Dreissena polymorpha TaxID=45954 RepID=A0A9D4G618_DREPO|nr:hypothetical protein DPMN_139296 [Dreissena polymorpha]